MTSQPDPRAPAAEPASRPAERERAGASRVAERLEAIRVETRFEIRLLHERVNALLAAEAFLTIACTAAMSSRGSWVAVVAPVLSALGLLLAAMAWPGVTATARLVTRWGAETAQVLREHPAVGSVWAAAHADGRRRGLLFFRAVPGAFAAVWVVLLVVALVGRG